MEKICKTNFKCRVKLSQKLKKMNSPKLKKRMSRKFSLEMLIRTFSTRVIGKLEDFCSSGEFTTFLSEFAREHSSKFNYTEEEQSLESYQAWMDFKGQIDRRLEEFISS